MCSGHMEGLELGIISRSAGHLDCLNCIKHNCTTIVLPQNLASQVVRLSTTHGRAVQNPNRTQQCTIQSRGVGNSRNIKMVVDLGVRPQLIPPQPPPSICNASKHTDTHTHTNTYTNKHTYAYTHAHNVQTGGRRENDFRTYGANLIVAPRRKY